MARIVMKFGGTSMAGIERIRHVAERRPARGRGGQRGAGGGLGDGRRDRPAGQLVPRGQPRSTIPTEYDVVVASGEQVTAGLLAHDPAEHGRARRAASWAGSCVRASGVHGNARVDAVESGTLDEALSGGTVAVIPGFQGVSRRRPAGDARPRRIGHFGGRDRGRRSRPTAATSTPTSTGSTPPTRASSPKARKLDAITFEEMLELAGVGAKVLQTRSVGLAMRENLPLRVLSAFEDKPGTPTIVARAFRSGHGKKPDRRHRRRQE